MDYINSQGKVTFFLDEGHGSPVILIHGVGLDHAMWRFQMEALTEHHRVVCYDMLGHGRTAPCSESCQLGDFIQQLSELIGYLGLERVHLVGFSMGGLVAEGFSIEFPHKVASMTLISSVAQRTPEQRANVLARVRQVEQNGHISTIEPAIARWFTPTFIENHHDTVNAVRQRLEGNDHASYLAAYRVFATADSDYFDRLNEIRCPTLIITGEHDVGSTPQMAYEIGKRVHGSKVTIVPDVKHMLPVEGKDEVISTLLPFLEEVDKSRSHQEV